jgi:hypothetical protein
MSNIEDEGLPKLSIEEENEFKKLKLNFEFGGDFSNFEKSNLDPAIESQFLDYISIFENQFKNAKRITVYEKLGKPVYKKVKEIRSEIEMQVALRNILNLLEMKRIFLEVLCHYVDSDRLIYTFITEELFLHEMDDINIEGMNTNFTYEEFHPNAMYDVEYKSKHFLEMFLSKKTSFYDDYHSEDAKNHIELNSFRKLFRKFKIKFLEFREIHIENENASINFNIHFWGKLEVADTKIYFSGDGNIKLNYKNDHWRIAIVNLPI